MENTIEKSKDPLNSYYLHRFNKPKKPKSNFKRYIFDKKFEYVTTKNYYKMKEEGFPSEEWFIDFNRKNNITLTNFNFRANPHT